jgi:hypothetical protein
MGAPAAYEYRRQELIDLQGFASGSQEVEPWRSFVDQVHPTKGVLTKYLELGQLAVQIGDVLFVHGAVHKNNFG